MNQEMVRNPETGLLEPKKYLEHRSSSNTSNENSSVHKMSNFLSALKSDQEQQATRVQKIANQQAETAKQIQRVQAEYEQKQREKEQKELANKRESEERIKQKNESDLAQALKANRQLHRGHRA